MSRLKNSFVFLVTVVGWIGGCKPPEPAPSQYVDLGTSEDPLPPTPQVWHDPGIAKGTAEWKPFRKPALPDAGDATAKAEGGPKKPAPKGDVEDGGAAGGGLDAEKEIRGIVTDFNAALEEKDLEKAFEFLTDAQAEVSGDVFAAVHELIEQLRALQAAAPALTEKIDALLPILNLSDSLKMELSSIRLVDAMHATAKLAGGGEARFEIGAEDFWYVESPVLALLATQKERLQKAAGEIKEALAKGPPDEPASATLGTMLDELHSALSGKGDSREGA